MPALEVLIPLSVRKLQLACYSAAQIESALGTIFAVDQQLIFDRTYFVVESEGRVVGCGGWSKRAALFGGNRPKEDPGPLLDPRRDSARMRAFFVHPDWARQGIGRSVLMASEQASIDAGFANAELVATLAGEPLYAAFGYSVVERYELSMQTGLTLPVVRMTRRLAAQPRV